MNDTIRIALTPGEPAGVGLDLCLKLAQIPQAAELVAICDPALLSDRAQLLGMETTLQEFSPSEPVQPHTAGQLKVLPVTLATPVQCGEPQTNSAAYILQTLDAAVHGCEQGTFSAMVTGPVDKGIISSAGFPFTGHTEYLATRTGASKVVMLLAAPQLRLALLTTHIPLSEVAAAITEDRIFDVLQVVHQGLSDCFGITSPRILVCGLNPHAGEGGHLGKEELETISPALDQLRAKGMRLIGPVSADTAFTSEQLEKVDVVLAMYHDQGLPAFKHISFGNAVNVTLGLPIVRTSVDHGTALDLAGTGKADVGSLQAALDTAIEIAARKPART